MKDLLNNKTVAWNIFHGVTGPLQACNDVRTLQEENILCLEVQPRTSRLELYLMFWVMLALF